MKSCFIFAVVVLTTSSAAPSIQLSLADPGMKIVRHTRSTCNEKTVRLTSAEKTSLLAKHNELRGQVSPTASDMAKMSWDDDLAKLAQWSADNCTRGHHNMKTCDGASVGQNAAYAYGTTSGVDTVVTNWYNEYHNYTYSSNSCDSGEVCGHYTQVAWAKSLKVGCASNVCASIYMGAVLGTWTNARVVYCNYSPAGNFIGNKPYQSGTACTQCETDNGYLCESNLCVPCIPEDTTPSSACICGRTCGAHGTLDANKCKCICSSPYYGPACESACENAAGDGTCVGWNQYCTNAPYLAFMTANCPKQCGFCSV